MDNPGARLKFPVQSWFGAETFWHRSREPHKLANNTYVEKLSDEEFGVKLHNTLIVVYSLGGKIKLDSGGYHTTTTKARINELLPPGYRVWQEKFEWFVTVPSAEAPREFVDGMILDTEQGNPPVVVPTDVVAAVVNPDFPVTDFFQEKNAGQWIDGALGEAHARQAMRNILDQLVAHAATEDQKEVLEGLMRDLREGGPGDDLNETLNDATDVLDWFTADGYVWDWEAGDLVLLPDDEV